jgi:hypothetical protein
VLALLGRRLNRLVGLDLVVEQIAASIAIGSSGTIGMWNVIRSPALSPSSFSTAANSLTRTYSSR